MPRFANVAMTRGAAKELYIRWSRTMKRSAITENGAVVAVMVSSGTDVPDAVVDALERRFVSRIVPSPTRDRALLKDAREVIDWLFARLAERDETFMPSESGEPWRVVERINRVLGEA